MNHPKGFTLIELLVYIVLTSIIVVIAGRAFTDATNQRLRTTRLLESTMGTGDAIAYLDEDLRRMGGKAWMQQSSTSAGASSSSFATLNLVQGVYWDPNNLTSPDSSSFISTPTGSGSNRLDAIEFRTAIYNPQTSYAVGSEQIRWSVTNGILSRVVVARRDLNGLIITSSTSSDSVVIARNVVEFKLRYGLQTIDSVLLKGYLQSPCPVSPSSASAYTLVLMSGSSAASVAEGAVGVRMSGLPQGGSASFQLMNCPTTGGVATLDMKSGGTYRVTFGLGSNDSAAANFRSDKDYIGVGVRNPTVLSSKISN